MPDVHAIADRCDDCKRCLCIKCHPTGPCEVVHRGRRFFMLGALFAPLAAKLPKLVQPNPVTLWTAASVTMVMHIAYVGQEWTGGTGLTPESPCSWDYAIKHVKTMGIIYVLPYHAETINAI